jgi:hypothetical protein
MTIMEIIPDRPNNPYNLEIMKLHLPLGTASLCAALFFATNVTQATVLDLGSSGSGSLADALFSTTDIQPTGTGVFDPFLTIQNTPTEQGYNSSDLNFDTKRVPQWNHEIQFSQLQTTTINGAEYFGFVIDVNEPNGPKSLISLDSLKIWTSATLQNSTSTDAEGNFSGSLGNLVFDLGAGNSVTYEDSRHGSGSGDINVFIPVADFAGVSANDYIYMYQRWGSSDMSDGGFEETALIAGVVPIPEVTPSSVIFGFLGLIVAVSSRRALAGRVRALASRDGRK